MEVVAQALDGRMKEAITEDANYQLGDVTKKKLSQSITEFTWKESYQMGEIFPNESWSFSIKQRSSE
jgi:hypothetical protein